MIYNGRGAVGPRVYDSRSIRIPICALISITSYMEVVRDGGGCLDVQPNNVLKRELVFFLQCSRVSWPNETGS